MTPEDLRKLYRDESPATDNEARETANEARTNPDQARRLLLTLYALGGEDREFAELLNLVLKVATMQLIALKAHEDDDFALKMAELILDGMQQMAKAAQRTPRGRQAGKKVRTA